VRRGASSIAANPVLIGAATTLVVVVAVFLAYNANSGLPFVPTYALNAEIPSGANLVAGNEVRVGGSRVGVVEDIETKRYPDGRVTAIAKMKLETTVQPLPRDTTVVVRPRSALGLKYVELTKGTSDRGWEDGSTMPLSAATPRPVEIDEFFNTFDERTREAQQTNLTEFGNAFVGRGQDLNEAIGNLDELFGYLEPVMRNLARDDTRLGELFVALQRTASEAAGVAETQAALFRNLDTTFRAISRVARPFLQETISEGPATLDASVRSFRVQRPFLRNSEGLFRELRPGVRALRGTATDIAGALEVGRPALRRSVQLNRRLVPTFESLQRFAESPSASLGLRGLGNTVRILDPTIRRITPAQTVCNYASLFFRNIASLLSEGDANGTWQRFIVVTSPQGPNNEGGPSSRPARGPNRDNFLHTNPYPNTAQPGASVRECEAGNEPYLAGRQVIGNVPGNQGTRTERTRIDRSTNP
jgi:virulence factor Mce-like protein